MSGRRGYLTKDQTSAIEEARRRLRDARTHPQISYGSAISEFVSFVYGCLGVAPPKIYRFSSPLACMLALPRVMGMHSDNGTLYVLTDLTNAFNSRLTGVREPNKDDNMASVVSQAVGSITSQEHTSDLFKETFVRQMKQQCKGTENEFRALTRSLSPLHGKDWWSSAGPGGTWIWPYNEFVVACDKPIRMEFDDRARPHREDDAAIEFADSYRVWAWHGVLVPKEVILFPGALSFTNVEKEQNVEVRRIMIERIGHGKYLKQAEAVLVDMDALTLDGSAPRALMKDKLGNMWLVGTDGSTARVYTMAVPPDVKTCKEAHERICGFEESRLIAEA